MSSPYMLNILVVRYILEIVKKVGFKTKIKYSTPRKKRKHIDEAFEIFILDKADSIPITIIWNQKGEDWVRIFASKKMFELSVADPEFGQQLVTIIKRGFGD